MTLLSCFRKSLKPKSKSWNSDSSSSSNATPALATSQAFPSSYDTITPAGPPPVYTPTAPESKTGEITSIPAINYPSNAIPRTFSNNLTTQPQTHRPPSISSFTSSNGPVLNDEDDKFAFLKDFDTVLLVDDSGSMSGPRWSETRDALKALLPIVTKRDNDGIDIYFLNHKSSDKGDAREGKAGTGYRNITSVRKVEAIFKEVRPSGRTPTARRLREIMKPYIEHLTAAKRRGEAAFEAVKPMNLLCVTDGIAEGNVEGVIVEVAEKLDALDAISEQVGTLLNPPFKLASMANKIKAASSSR